MALRKTLAALLCALLLSPPAPAQHASSPAAEEAAQPKVTITQAPPETPEQFSARKLALQEMLQRLTTTGRIMQVVAHPDDEDGAMLTLESRVKGNTAELFTFTRGEGGQNAQGAVFFDELGLLRTLELLAADKEYGAEERFSHLADFGFSKTADETYQKWGGRDVPLKDLVEAVRAFQPDVLVARFSGTQKDGHGHHQASAQLTVQAFHDAADAKRFPQAGEAVWQASKLYSGLAGDAATLVPDETQPSPLLNGKTPQEVAIAGLRHQESQGAGNWKGPIPKVYSSYKLLDTADGISKPGHETNFFQGVNTSLAGLADRFPLETSAHTLALKNALLHISELVNEARGKSEYDINDAVEPLALALRALDKQFQQPAVRYSAPLSLRLIEKREQLVKAILLAEGISASLMVNKGQKTDFVSPGEQVELTLQLTNLGKQTVDTRGKNQPHLSFLDGFDFPKESSNSLDELEELPRIVEPGTRVALVLNRRIGANDAITRQYFSRRSAVTDTAYEIDRRLQPDNGAALSACDLGAFLYLSVMGADGSLALPAIGHSLYQVFVAPPVSVMVEPAAILHRLNHKTDADITVNVRNHSKSTVSGELKLQLPQDVTSSPASLPLQIAAAADSQAKITISWQASSASGQNHALALFSSNGKSYSENYHLITRPDLPDAFPYYAPAQTTISLIDADIPAKHNIGYIMGAGDTIPDDLTSLGFTVHLLTPEDLANADLSCFDAIVTGVRAYATRPDLREHNQRLLDYVKQGGTMLVQYEQDIDGFNKGNYLPYPATMGRDRVSQEEQPVTVLQPDSPIFHYPNQIKNADFDNWVQERGLYFMKDWSDEYTPLLEMHDAGEAPLKGGLLVAHYGKGTYITTSLAFYRELPNGVPGATRLFINLLGAGQAPSR